MNVAIVTNLFPPIQIGSSYWSKELATSLARQGDEVIVITWSPSGKATVEEKEGVIIYRLPPAFRLPRTSLTQNFDQFYLLWSRANLRGISSILREHRIELIHQCGQLLDSLLLTCQVRRQLNLPVVCSIHTKVFHPDNRLFDTVLHTIDRLAIRHLMQSFDLVVALDRVVADYVHSTYHSKRVEILPVCIDSSMTLEPPAHPAAPGPVHIVSLGHVTEMRSRKELLEALAVLRDRGMDVRLTIAGKVLTTRTQSMVDALGLSQAVRLVGEVPRGPKLVELLRSAHTEAHWLDMPGIGTAALEAMALGLPVVTYGYEGIYGDVPLRQGENIMFIDPQRPETVLLALQRLVESPELRVQVGSEARRLVREQLTWNTAVHRIRYLYDEILQTIPTPTREAVL